MFLGHDRVVYFVLKKQKPKKNKELIDGLASFGSVTRIGKEFYPRFISRIKNKIRNIEFVLYFMQIIGEYSWWAGVWTLIVEQITERYGRYISNPIRMQSIRQLSVLLI